MARGKIQIRKIENSTNRQVTYSKRRNGLFKKAAELTVLCDAKVSIIMISTTAKLHEYISPCLETKQFFDLYQKTMGIDLWNSHYERMQKTLRKEKDKNRNLRREIRQRLGESLNDLNFQELHALEEDVENSVRPIRERKLKVISNQTDTAKKKVKNAHDIHRNLLHEFDLRGEDPHYGLVDNGGEYETALGYSLIGAPRFVTVHMLICTLIIIKVFTPLLQYPILILLLCLIRALDLDQINKIKLDRVGPPWPLKLSTFALELVLIILCYFLNCELAL